MQRRTLRILALALLAVGLTADPARAADLPVEWNGLTGYERSFQDASAPAGANDPSCRSSHRPVVLVHGTGGNQADFAAISPFLRNHGFCPWTFNYGGQEGDILWAHEPIESAAADLRVFVGQVLTRTGATKVDIVGHSLGGMMPRYYIKFLGGGAHVHKLIGISPSNHGVTISGLTNLGSALDTVLLAAGFESGVQQVKGSPFLKKLQSCPGGRPQDICPGDTVDYTVLAVNGDQVVTPWRSAFLQGATNIEVNRICPRELTEHLGVMFSRNVAQLVLRALDPSVTQKVCVVSLPYAGG